MSEYIYRILEDRLKKAQPPKAHLIYGARQVGKSSLLRHLLENQRYEWITGESPSTSQRLNFDTEQDVLDFLNAYKVIVIDEAQFVGNIGRCIKRMVDQKTDALIFITASSSLKLIKGVQESAVGRIEFHTLFPLSVSELVKDKSKDWVKKNLERMLVLGSYPEVISNFDEDADTLSQYMLDYVNGVFLQDIYQLAEIRKSNPLMNLLSILAASVGSQITYGGLARETGMHKETIERYLDLLEQNFVIFRVNSYANNITNELKKSKKIYFFDNGVRNALLDNFSQFSLRTDKEALFENFIASELYKMHSYQRDRTHLYFWRTAQGKEIDFLEVKDQKILRAIECKSSKNARLHSCEKFTATYGVERTVVTPENIFQILLPES